MDIEEKLKKYFGKVERINKRTAEDAEDYILPDNPAAILADYEDYAETLDDDNPQKHNLQVFIRMAKNDFNQGAEDDLKVSMLKVQRCYEAICYNNMVEKLQEPRRHGAIGGKRGAEVRAQTREKVREKSKEYILKLYLWNDGTQTIKSITDTIWAEIQTAMDSGNEWQGISNNDLLQAKIGRRSVYDAVKETAPR